MQTPTQRTVATWFDDVTGMKTYPQPEAGLSANVCVIGAGISGLTAAYLLLKAGKSVVVLDERGVAAGETGRTSAHLTSANDDYFAEIEKMHGKDGARVAYESHDAAIREIERISLAEKIDCDFKWLDGYLFSIPNDKPDRLQKELDAAQRAGFTDSELLPSTALNGYVNGPAIRFGKQARFHPLKYMLGLAAAVEKMNGRIRVGKRVKEIKGADDKIKSVTISFEPGQADVKADALIVATNAPAPIPDWVSIYTKQASYTSYMVGLRVPAGSVTDALYWDTEDPYHYARLIPGKDGADDVLIVGGADHKVGQIPDKTDAFAQVEQWTRTHFPLAREVVTKWSGEVQEPTDGLGFIGVAPTKGENVYVITGDSGMGLTHGTLGAMLVTDLIMGQENPWQKTYDPSRAALTTERVTENANTAAQYVDLVTGGDVASIDDIPAGEGALIRQGLHKLAVYKASDGTFHKMSALCTHLKCVVQWNGTEDTWDCPCHGSRFDATGKVLMGPAVDNLPAAT